MWATVSKAVPIFVVTNIDDLLLVTLFFGIAGRNRAAAARIIIGQYAGFAGILGLSFLGAYGAERLLAATIPYAPSGYPGDVVLIAPPEQVAEQPEAVAEALSEIDEQLASRPDESRLPPTR